MAHVITHQRRIELALSVILGLALAGCGATATTQQSAAAQKNVSADTAPAMVLGVRREAPPPPPTPAPAKYTTPESYYQPVGPFFFYVETLTSTGPSTYGFTPTQPCIQTGVFKRGMRMVVRFEVLDTSTGKRITDRDGATIKLLLPHGEEVPGRWTIRGSVAAMPDSAWMWDTSWDIPPDYPIGSLDYRILVATKDGRTATFTPPIQKTKTADTRVRIID